MIRANTRCRLSAADLQLVILLLSRGSPSPARVTRAQAGSRGARRTARSARAARTVARRADDVSAVGAPLSVRRHPACVTSSRYRQSRSCRLPRLVAAGFRPAGPRVAGRLARRPATPVSSRYSCRHRGQRRRAPLPGYRPPGELRALARRHLSRLYRRPAPPQRRAGCNVLRCAGAPGLCLGVGPFARYPIWAWYDPQAGGGAVSGGPERPK